MTSQDGPSIEELFARGAESWPTLPVARTAFERHMGALAAQSSPPQIQHAGDVYLACACALGLEGALAAFSAKLARRCDVPECRMIMRREEKGEMMLAQGARGLVRGEFHRDAEGLEHVGAAGLGSDGAVAMLGHRDARRGADQCDGRGDIEGVEPVAARAADIQNFPRPGFGVERRLDGQGAQLAGEGGDLVRRLNFAGEFAQKIGLKLRRHGLLDQLPDGGGNLFFRKVDRVRKLLFK